MIADKIIVLNFLAVIHIRSFKTFKHIIAI